jgi:hypothetical protein
MHALYPTSLKRSRAHHCVKTPPGLPKQADSALALLPAYQNLQKRGLWLTQVREVIPTWGSGS